jgi:hypothetical protein
MDGMHEPCEARQNSPRNQNARNPDACANLLQEQNARNFEDKVAKKEDAGRRSRIAEW